MKVFQASKSDYPLIEQFCKKNKVYSHCANPYWLDVISKSFGHKSICLVCKEGDVIKGFLGLVFVNSLLFGKSVSSLPYLNDGAFFFETEEALELLIAKARQLAKNFKYLEIRTRSGTHFEGAKEVTGKVAMSLELASSSEEMFESFSAKLRSQIRRPKKSGVVFKEFLGNEGESLLQDFYQVFCINMRDLGTPVYPISLFKNTLGSFGERAKIIVGYKEETPIAAGISVHNKIGCEIIWASSVREHNNLSANMEMYWRFISWAISEGCSYFDFGRTTLGSGTYKFKKQWGALPETLHWHYFVNQGKVPDITSDNKKFKLAVRIWKHLPLTVTKKLGPYITKNLP